MTVLGVVAFDLFSLAVLAWLLDSVRRGRLYVGYGVILILLDIGVASMVSVPGLRALTATVLGALFPAAPVAVIGFALTALLLIYVLGQLTILSNRLAVLVQELALERAHHQRPSDADVSALPPDTDAPSLS